MKKNYKYLVGLIVLSVVGFLVLILLNRPKVQTPESESDQSQTRPVLPTPTLPPPAPEGKRGIREDKKMAMGTQEVSFGVFNSSNGEVLNYSVDGTAFALPFSDPNEFVYGCSDQDIEASNDFYFDYINKIKVIKPTELANYLENGTGIVVLASEIDGVYKAYTLVVNQADCKI